MPRSRKRHHSRSRSRSRSLSRDRSHERDEKLKKNDSRDKDREGKRRKIEAIDSPPHKRSVSSNPDPSDIETSEIDTLKKHEEMIETIGDKNESCQADECSKEEDSNVALGNQNEKENQSELSEIEDVKQKVCSEQKDASEKEKMDVFEVDSEQNEDLSDSVIILDESDDKTESGKEGATMPKKNSLEITPKKVLSPKQLQKRHESEKKRQLKQKEREEKEKKKQEEKERMKQEKIKKKEEKQKELEQKQKEKELKEEQKRKEREEKEQKRKEKEEKEEQKRKEREQEKLKRQQEIDEKNKEKQKEEEKKQKTAAAFVSFFVPKKSDNLQDEKKAKVTQPSAFMSFEVKSDMKLPPVRRQPLSETEKQDLEHYIENQNETASYIRDLKSGKLLGRSNKTWPFEDPGDDDVTIVEEEGNLGETICEDKPKRQKFRAKFLKFHVNRRPAYFGTWRKKSSFVKPRKPFGVDEGIFNYEEDSDDDWEEEEQGESLNGSEDEADKENEDEKDDYEVDNDFFVPHGHLSDDEIDDEESARLSPESLKQKLKLLKDEFDQDMQLKTHKLKPRSIGCIWYNQDGSNIEEAIHRYLQPLAIISNGQIQIKKRSELLSCSNGKKPKSLQELNPEHIPLFLKVIHGNSNKKRVLIEQFLTYMANNGITIDISKAKLLRILKSLATWRKCNDNGPLKNKLCWLVNDDISKKYNVSVAPGISENDSKK